MSFSVSFVEKDGQQVMSIAGDLTQSSLKQDFFVELDKIDAEHLQAITKLNVDLQQVDGLDTAGLAWLVNMLKDFNTKSIAVTFSNIPEKLNRLAALSNAKSLFGG